MPPAPSISLTSFPVESKPQLCSSADQAEPQFSFICRAFRGSIHLLYAPC